ncbi:hypothetical protein HDU92_004703 [Lobulomyces angularis]|nr:hypothetical protein HDU92_004703 [Lobulomyces angularis]
MQITEDALYATSDKFIVSWERKTGEQIYKVGTIDSLYGLNIVNNNIYSNYNTAAFIEKWNMDFTNKEIIEGVTPNGTYWARRQDDLLIFGSHYNYITIFDTVKGTTKMLNYGLNDIVEQHDINRSSDITSIL